MNDSFSALHPALTFCYFAAVLLLTMLVLHPVFLALSLLGALGYCAVLRGWRSLGRTLGWLVPFLVLMAALNALLNHAGVTMLFYLPNGNPPNTEKYPYKLAWMERLTVHARGLLAHEEPLVLAGDYNVIPEPRDARDPAAWAGDALFLPPTRTALSDLYWLSSWLKDRSSAKRMKRSSRARPRIASSRATEPRSSRAISTRIRGRPRATASAWTALTSEDLPIPRAPQSSALFAGRPRAKFSVLASSVSRERSMPTSSGSRAAARAAVPLSGGRCATGSAAGFRAVATMRSNSSPTSSNWSADTAATAIARSPPCCARRQAGSSTTSGSSGSGDARG